MSFVLVPKFTESHDFDCNTAEEGVNKLMDEDMVLHSTLYIVQGRDVSLAAAWEEEKNNTG